MITRIFKLKENKTTITTEVTAGLTTFMTMAYILVINPQILAVSGMDYGGVFTATALGAAVGTLAMALLANYPFAMASGMGLNAYFALTVASAYGWQTALLAAFAQGVIFIFLSLSKVREALFDAIPQSLKCAVSVGTGTFIALVGFKSAGIVTASPSTIVAFGDIRSLSVILALTGIVLTGFLVSIRVKGALLLGILGIYLIGVACEFAGLYVPNPETGIFSLIPGAVVQLPPSISDVSLLAALRTINFDNFNIVGFSVVVFALLITNIFGAVGTLTGVSYKAGFLDRNNKLPRAKQAFLANAIGTTTGAVLGTSTIATYVESASGVSAGGRTGLTAAVVSALFLLSLFFAPVFSVIPAFATAPALVIVGVYMMEPITQIDFSDFTEALPAFMAIVMMPFTNDMAKGLVFGVLSYVAIKLLAGKKEQVSSVMLVIASLFLFSLILG